MDPSDPTDAELVARTRRGDTAAYGVLFVRHLAVARRVASGTVRPADVDDVVAEAFTAVLVQLRRGRGPTTDVRAYVLTAVRHEGARRTRRLRRLGLCADVEVHLAAADPDLLEDEHDEVGVAYRSLPPRWRHVLWMLEVEGRKPHELALELGLTPNAVSALGCRARAGLRVAIAHRAEAA